MSNRYKSRVVRESALGLTVTKQITPVTNVYNSLFTITGGLIAVTALVGEVTTIIANTASLTAKLQATPSGGSAGDLCAATGITNDAVGTLYSLTSTVATDLMNVQSVSAIGGTPVAASEVPNVTYCPILWRPIVLRAGTVGLTISNHAITGAIKWYMTYAPLVPGASVAAA